ncbi:hypothetical protein VULLAG_LOCUS23177 [Vulpes lagopus]
MLAVSPTSLHPRGSEGAGGASRLERPRWSGRESSGTQASDQSLLGTCSLLGPDLSSLIPPSSRVTRPRGHCDCVRLAHRFSRRGFGAAPEKHIKEALSWWHLGSGVTTVSRLTAPVMFWKDEPAPAR